MKKIIAVFIIVSIILCSCAGSADKSKFFDYQEKEINTKGIWSENGKEYEVELTLGKTENGERDTEKIVFLSPKTVEGATYVFEKGELTATMGDMTVKMNAECRDNIFRLHNMFSLKSSEIKSIDVDEEGNTVAKGKNWSVTTDKNGVPKEISLDNSKFTVEEYK